MVSDAYDGWGAIYGTTDPSSAYNNPYAASFNGLDATRQTQSYVAVPTLPANSVRWFDSFTNSTGSTISANIAFGGNLGSDSNTFVHSTGPGYFVTGQNGPGISSGDPVIAHLYGNNDYAFTQASVNAVNGDDNPFVIFPIEVAPGQTVSVMFVDLLFGDTQRNNDPGGIFYASDVTLAIEQAQLFVNSPIFDGLTVEQLQTLINWGVSADGSLPAAGALGGVSLGMHGAFDSFLSANQALSNVPTGGAATEPLQYASSERPIASQTQSFAYALGKAGGKVMLTANGDANSYLFGGYTAGSFDYTAGSLDFSGYVAGIGAERAISERMLVGIAGGYANGDGDMAGVYNDLSSEQVTVAPYVKYQTEGGTVIDGRVSLSTESWDYSRVAGAGIAAAGFDGWSFGARMGISHSFDTGQVKLTPFASISYLGTHVNGYTETGAGAANLVVPSFTAEHAEAFVGVSAAQDWVSGSGMAVRGYVSAGVGTGFLGGQTIQTQFTTAATSFATQVEGVDDVFARVGAGLSAEIKPGLSFSGSYGGTFGKDRSQHSIGAKLTASF